MLEGFHLTKSYSIYICRCNLISKIEVFSLPCWNSWSGTWFLIFWFYFFYNEKRFSEDWLVKKITWKDLSNNFVRIKRVFSGNYNFRNVVSFSHQWHEYSKMRCLSKWKDNAKAYSNNSVLSKKFNYIVVKVRWH